MPGGLPCKDQRTAGEVYGRRLLTDGSASRCSRWPRLGWTISGRIKFITSATWDYAVVRGDVPLWFAAAQPVEALVGYDIGFAKNGSAG